MDTSSSSDWDKLELLMKQMKDLYREMYTSSDYFVLKTLSADCLESPNGRFDNKVEVTAAFRKVCQVSYFCTGQYICTMGDIGDEC